MNVLARQTVAAKFDPAKIVEWVVIVRSGDVITHRRFDSEAKADAFAGSAA